MGRQQKNLRTHKRISQELLVHPFPSPFCSSNLFPSPSSFPFPIPFPFFSPLFIPFLILSPSYSTKKTFSFHFPSFPPSIPFPTFHSFPPSPSLSPFLFFFPLLLFLLAYVSSSFPIPFPSLFSSCTKLGLPVHITWKL